MMTFHEFMMNGFMMTFHDFMMNDFMMKGG